MRFNVIAAVVAVVMFGGYFAPLIIKLKDLPLSLILLGGIVMMMVDVWESLSNKNGNVRRRPGP